MQQFEKLKSFYDPKLVTEWRIVKTTACVLPCSFFNYKFDLKTYFSSKAKASSCTFSSKTSISDLVHEVFSVFQVILCQLWWDTLVESGIHHHRQVFLVLNRWFQFVKSIIYFNKRFYSVCFFDWFDSQYKG